MIRFGADLGRLRRPAMHGLLSVPIAELESRGWTLDWLPVRRRLNSAADAVATAAVFQAATLAEAGKFDPVITTQWY